MGSSVLHLLLIVLLMGARLSAASDTIHGCGGFVEASPDLAKARRPSDPKPDYSHITIELLTLDGLVKDRVQCAPNGYYFLPVYDKGTFILHVRGPSGWSWSPEKVSVVVDHKGCNDNEDINFLYSGFSLSGKVVGAVGGHSCGTHSGNGPSDVIVSLDPISHPPDVQPSVSVSTSNSGDFQFANLIPGRYRLRAHHPTLNVQVKGDQNVEIGFGNMNVGDFFFVPGYNLEGFVVSQGNPVLGVHVYLYSDDVKEVPCVQESGSLPSRGQALCHAVSDANGKFTFHSLPCGKYKLVPFYRGENTVFDVSPAFMDVDVGHDEMILAEPFKVTGFSVGGRVIDSQGGGVEGVEILVNDGLKAVTDIGGFYKLDQVTSSRYTIKAQKPHYEFSTLDSFMVLPNIASLPDIVASKYDLCGSVLVDSSMHSGKRQVALTHGPASVKAQTKWVDNQGSFCFVVPPGEYRLSPIVTKAEQSSGLVFTPEYIDVLVMKPVFDIVLMQAQVRVSGYMNCIGKCDSRAHVSITPFLHGTKSLDSSRTQNTGLIPGLNGFQFEKVLPGKYQLVVWHEPLAQVPDVGDDWCWEDSTIEKDVGTTDLTDVQFTQKGYWMSLHSTHAAEASISQPDGEAVVIEVQKGWQKVCLKQPGIHKLSILKSCTSFGLFPFLFDTLNPAPLNLVGQKYVLEGTIILEGGPQTDPEVFASNMVVLVWRDDGSFADSNNRLQPMIDAHGRLSLHYEHWADMGDSLTLIPRDIRGFNSDALSTNPGEPTSKQFLFYPKERHVRVELDGCQPEIPAFVGRSGMYIEGHVLPALEGVSISVVVDSDSDSVEGSFKKGDVVMNLLTGEDGSYVAGPLYDDMEYVVRAAKDGFHCKPIDSHRFACQKLGQIVVNIVPGEGAEEVLPAVLLSLSGDNGFRRNAITGSGGVYVFDGLFPGSFFLRPLLKEYSFSPASLAIDLESGGSLELSFSASRISFSVLGTVMSLIGKPEEGISVEARSESKGFYEESATDSDGKYRLRGLLPDTAYTVKVVLKEDSNSLSQIERASPLSYMLQVGANDTRAVDFVVFHQPQVTIITGTAEGTALEKWQRHLTVRVVSIGDSSKVESVIPLPLSGFFEVQGLPRGKYSVQLMLELSEKTHRFESEAVNVDLGWRPQTHVGVLRFVVEEQHQKQDLASAPVLPMLIGLLVITLAASTPRLLKEGQQLVAGSGLSASTATITKKEVRKPALRKRTY